MKDQRCTDEMLQSYKSCVSLMVNQGFLEYFLLFFFSLSNTAPREQVDSGFHQNLFPILTLTFPLSFAPSAGCIHCSTAELNLQIINILLHCLLLPTYD